MENKTHCPGCKKETDMDIFKYCGATCYQRHKHPEKSKNGLLDRLPILPIIIFFIMLVLIGLHGK